MVRFIAHITADLDAGIGSGDIEEPGAIDAANLHVFDRFGLNGKIGSLCSSDRNEPAAEPRRRLFTIFIVTSKFALGRVQTPLGSSPNEVPLFPANYPAFRRIPRKPAGQRDLGTPPLSQGQINDADLPCNLETPHAQAVSNVFKALLHKWHSAKAGLGTRSLRPAQQR